MYDSTANEMNAFLKLDTILERLSHSTGFEASYGPPKGEIFRKTWTPLEPATHYQTLNLLCEIRIYFRVFLSLNF
jgi:hypothetical protein